MALYVAFLDSSGNANVFQQEPSGGVWSGPVVIAAPLGITLTAIAGVSNYLVALGSDGNLYASVFSQSGALPQPTDWSSFVALPALGPYIINGSAPINDFALAPFSNVAQNTFSLVIVAAFNSSSQGVAGFYSYSLDLSSTPANLPQAIAANAANNSYWNLIAESQSLSVSGGTAPALGVINQGANPTLAFIGVPPTFPGTSPGWSASWSSTDGAYWTPGNLNEVLTGWFPFGAQISPTYNLIVVGNVYPTLQAVILWLGQPIVCYSTDGVFWWMGGDVMPPNNPGPGDVPGFVNNPPTFSTAAAGIGNSGNLQLIGLGPDVYYGSSAPFLVWQDVNGKWSLYPYDPQSDGYLSLVNGFLEIGVTPSDVAIGLGWCNEGRALQVVYLGSDFNVYVTWQDTFGGWHWYPGLGGQGLP